MRGLEKYFALELSVDHQGFGRFQLWKSNHSRWYKLAKRLAQNLNMWVAAINFRNASDLAQAMASDDVAPRDLLDANGSSTSQSLKQHWISDVPWNSPSRPQESVIQCDFCSISHVKQWSQTLCSFPIRFLQYLKCKSMITNRMFVPDAIVAVSKM